jgi:hypothetical protein
MWSAISSRRSDSALIVPRGRAILWFLFHNFS